MGLLCIYVPSLQAETIKGLQAGEQASDFTAVNYKGEKVVFSDYYKDGPVVLIFYRGGWCMFCNKQLHAFQQSIEEFEELGVKIVALSVDQQDVAAKYVADKEFDFEIISNPEANILRMYDLVYEVPQDLRKKYKEEYKIDLQKASGRVDGIIAIPATYIVEQGGLITFAYANEDYRIRKSPQEILHILKTSNDK